MAEGELYPVAGMKIYIGSVMTVGIEDLVEADFADQTWTEIDGWSTCGPLGDTAALITTSLINRNRDVKQKGSANAGSMANVFAIVDDDPGQIALIAASAPSDKDNYAFKVEANDANPGTSFTATISNASPGVLTKVAHGLALNQRVRLATTGALPTGLAIATDYYVKTMPDADTFTLSATKGGTVINTSSNGSGTHTVTTYPSNSERLFCGMVMSAVHQGGEANTIRNLAATVEVNSNIVEVEQIG